MTDFVDINHFHLFCGLGGGAAGFNEARAEVGKLQARYHCIGGVDSDPAAVADFATLTGVQGTVLDLFDREQYIAWHGHEPPPGWRECSPADLQRAAGGRRPHIVFTSPPCKGFSGLLAEKHSKTDKYQALNKLTLRGIWLSLEAWKDDPVEFFILENVPRIMTRGRYLLDQIISLLEHYGYAVRETTHDCGEIGGLAQSRRRFLLVARHKDKVPAFLYEPVKRELRSVGSVLEDYPLPGIENGGPMHRVPSLQWKTWVRLAFVKAGSDWRSLNDYAVEDGFLRDYLLVPEMYNGALGVRDWEQPAATVTGTCRSYNGAHNVADPRLPDSNPNRQNGLYRITRFDSAASAVTGAKHVAGAAQSVADPRPGWNRHSNNYRVVRFDSPSPTVIGGGKGVQGGQLSVADPRVWPGREHYVTGAHYGVVDWNSATGAVTGRGKHDSGAWSIADPRGLPAATEKLQARIIAEDNTWHRPFTTLELAALQSLIRPEDVGLELHGASDASKRERIGNAVPRYAGTAIASAMGEALLLSMTGETFILSAQPVWVRPFAIALTLPHHDEVSK